MGRKINDLTGRVFGRLLVVRQNGKLGTGIAWLCVCDCGKTTTVRSQCLTEGQTQSCGCFKIEQHKKFFLNYRLSRNRDIFKEPIETP